MSVEAVVGQRGWGLRPSVKPLTVRGEERDERQQAEKRNVQMSELSRPVHDFHTSKIYYYIYPGIDHPCAITHALGR
jgi:hypothetical protein